MTDAKDREEDGTEPDEQALENGDSARQIAHLTGMSSEAATAYAAFHSGRWAQGPAGRRAA
jgi:hypothetical protein